MWLRESRALILSFGFHQEMDEKYDIITSIFLESFVMLPMKTLFFGRIFGWICMVVVAMQAEYLSGSTLEVNIDMTCGTSSEIADRPVNYYFVFDRSRSMTMKNNLFQGQLPNDVMLSRFRDVLEGLPRSAQVYYMPFSAKVGNVEGPRSVATKSARESLFDDVTALKIDSVTLLYDAQAAMFNFVQRHLVENPNLCAYVYVYTDGENQTDGCAAKYPSVYGHRIKNARTEKDQRYNEEQEQRYESEKQKAKRDFDDDNLSFVTNAQSRVTIERQYLSESGKPDDSEWHTRAMFESTLRGDCSKLQSPLSVERQRLDCHLHFPMPPKDWQTVVSKRAKAVLTVAGKRQECEFTLGENAQLSFVLPTMSAERETEAQLSVEGFPDDSQDFGIKPSNPLTMVFPKIGSVAISGMEPGPKNKFRVGEQVLFAAEGTDGAQFTWTFSDGVSKTMQKFARQFHEPGRYSFAVKAEKKPLASAQLKGEVEIIDAGALVKQVDAAIVAAKPAKFTAVVRGTPTGFDWFVNDIPVAGDGREMTYVFPKSGTYEVQVRAHYGNVTPAVSPKLPVVVGVTPLVNIVHPIAGADDILINQDIDLQADVDGEFASVEWSIKGPESKNLTSPVDRKRALAVGKLQLLKPGEYEVVARAKGAQGAELVSEPLHMTVSLPPSGIAVDMSENGRRVPFGTQVRLVAKPFGAVKDVTWSVRVSGKEVARIPGLMVNAPVVKADGKTPEQTITYLAEGKLSDGGEVRAQSAMMVVYYCPELHPRIEFAHADGGKSPEFSRTGDPVTLSLVDSEGRQVRSVDWDFGDGQKESNAATTVAHHYRDYGEYTIRVSCVCAGCGRVFSSQIAPVKIKVVKKDAVACFVVEPQKSSYGVRGVVHLVDKSIGDVGRRVWRVNGELIPDSENKTKVDYRLPSIPEDLEFSLEVTGTDGSAARPFQHAIRVRFGWWAALVFALAGVILVVALAWLLCGNGPRGWQVQCMLGGAEKRASRDYDPETDYGSYPCATPIGGRWNCFTKRAKISTGELMGQSDGSEEGDEAAGTFGYEGLETHSSDEKFIISKSQGHPCVGEPQSFSKEDSSRSFGASGEFVPHFLFRDNGRCEADKRFLRMFVDTSGEKSGVGAVVMTILLSLAVLSGIFIACMKYAI